MESRLVDGIAMAGERPPEETFIKEHCIRSAKAGKISDAFQSMLGIRFVEAMELFRANFRDAIRKQLTCGFDHGCKPFLCYSIEHRRT